MTTDFRLKRSVAVSPDPSRGAPPFKLVQLEAGTSLEEIPEIELAQLSPAHFVEVEVDDDGEYRPTGSDVEPEDWRTNPATLEADERQHKAIAREAKERAAEKAKRNKAAR